MTEQQLLDLGFKKQPYDLHAEEYNEAEHGDDYYLSYLLLPNVPYCDLSLLWSDDAADCVTFFPYDETKIYDLSTVEYLIKGFKRINK